MSEEIKKAEAKYKFILHDGSLLYSCNTDEKKNVYEKKLKSKNIKYTLYTLRVLTELKTVTNGKRRNFKRQ